MQTSANARLFRPDQRSRFATLPTVHQQNLRRLAEEHSSKGLDHAKRPRARHGDASKPFRTTEDRRRWLLPATIPHAAHWKLEYQLAAAAGAFAAVQVAPVAFVLP